MNVDISRVTIRSIIKDYILKIANRGRNGIIKLIKIHSPKEDMKRKGKKKHETDGTNLKQITRW